jgi:hypothetical protein
MVLAAPAGAGGVTGTAVCATMAFRLVLLYR